MKQRPHLALSSANVSDYRESFVRRVHVVLILGYDRMASAAFANHPEEEITEHLVAAIEQVFDSPAADISDWIDNFSVHEDRRLNAPGRHGKSRLRIDIRIESAEVRPRCRFLFEAKRLGKGHPATTYLGAEGLGAYLSGEYGANDSGAGMIGYIQQHDAAYWAAEISNELVTNPGAYGFQQGRSWQNEAIVPGFQFIYSTIHDRNPPMSAMRVFHSLFLFH